MPNAFMRRTRQTLVTRTPRRPLASSLAGLRPNWGYHREESTPHKLKAAGSTYTSVPPRVVPMGFRFRRSARFGPLRFNFAKSGLSSISLGGRGASFNIPIARTGGASTAVGLPGTGLSWSGEHSQEADRTAQRHSPLARQRVFPTAAASGPASSIPSSRGAWASCRSSCSRPAPKASSSGS